MSSPSFAEELRSRGDKALAELFAARPDLLTPVPSDISALAARANSQPSLFRARDQLTQWEFDVLTAMAILPEPFSELEVLQLVGKEAIKTIEILWTRGFTYKDGEKYRIPSNVRAIIGEFPAGLGPHATDKLNLKELKNAPDGALQLLERMAWGPPRGQVADVKKANANIKWLLDNKFLVAVDSQNVLMPREVGLHLRGGKIFKALTPKEPELAGTKRSQKSVDQAAIANVSTFIRWAEELAHNWSDEPPTALKSGGLGVRDLKATAEHLGVSEDCAAFVAEILYLGGLVVIDTDDQILPTAAFDAWLSREAEERWHNLVTLWLQTSRVAGLIGKADGKNVAALGPELDRSTIAALKRLTLNQLVAHAELDPDQESLAALLTWLTPMRANREYIQWILREAEWLGITGQGAISSFGIALLEGEDLGVQKALPAPVDHILIQGDNSAIAPGPLTVDLANSIGTIADIESRGGATVYRFSEGSIRRGLDHGQTGEMIKEFLKRVSKTPVPQPLEYLINDVAKRHGRLRVGVGSSYIRCEDEGLIQQIVHDKKLEDIHIRKLAPQVLISDTDLHDLVNALRDAGYLPAIENETGILVSAPAIRRAKSRPKPPRIVGDPTSPTPALITAAVKALRAGDKATANKPKSLPRTTANETLDILNQYIEEQASLTIGYADNNGGVTQKLIDPISISLGTLVARDHGTGEVAYFRIPRITGVAPASE
jgi:hypothetical protein